MKKIFSLLFLVFALTFIVQTASAKVLPQAKTGSKVANTKSTVAGISVSPRLRSDRRALIVYFSNLQNASAVSYLLTYQTNIQGEGAQGSIKLMGATTASQELLFGTCSKNVCTYHRGINNMKLAVSYTTKAGKKYIIRYKIKV